MNSSLAESAILGGTVSVLGGGKFENGAQSAAFAYVFNTAAHWQAERSPPFGVTSQEMMEEYQAEMEILRSYMSDQEIVEYRLDQVDVVIEVLAVASLAYGVGEVVVVAQAMRAMILARESAALALRPRGVPSGRVEQAVRKTGNTKYVNPANPHDYVRVKPGGTITQVRNGKTFDVNGNLEDVRSPEAHEIKPDKFIFRE